MYLTGSKQYNLDAKSRLTLPASYRKEFSESVCLIPLKDALYGFTPEGFELWVNSFFNRDGRTFDPRNRRDVALKRMLTGNTVTVDIDSAGRVALGKIDAAARARLGIQKDVTVVGVGDHFEVWDTAQWEAEQAAFADDIDALIYGDDGGSTNLAATSHEQEAAPREQAATSHEDAASKSSDTDTTNASDTNAEETTNA